MSTLLRLRAPALVARLPSALQPAALEAEGCPGDIGFVTRLLALLRVAPHRYAMCDNEHGEAVVQVKAGLLPQLTAMEEEGEQADEAAVEAVARIAAATLARDEARKAAAEEALAKKAAHAAARLAAAAVEGGSPRRRLTPGQAPPPERDAVPKKPSLPLPRPKQAQEAAAVPTAAELVSQGVAAAATAAVLEAEVGSPGRGAEVAAEVAVAPAEGVQETGRHRRGLRRQLGELKQAEEAARTTAADAASAAGAAEVAGKMEARTATATAAEAAEEAAVEAASKAAVEAAEEAAAWPIEPTAVAQFCTMFAEACAAQGAGVDRLGKAQAGAVLTSSGLPTQVLLQIWALADVDGDDQLDLQE